MALRVPYFIACMSGLLFALSAPCFSADGFQVSICGSKTVCGDMDTCAEAYHYLTQCGLSDLDRDNDGVPCEKICGKDIATMHARITAQPFTPSADTGKSLGLLSSPQPQAVAATCGDKTTPDYARS